MCPLKNAKKYPLYSKKKFPLMKIAKISEIRNGLSPFGPLKKNSRS